MFEKDAAHERYHRNTMAAERRIAGALRPTTTEQVQAIVRIANTHKIPLHAFSTGHDWGFGSSLPNAHDCVILDLSGMKRVIEFNDALGYVTVEPGVTQQDLYDYMQARGYEFMVPTTGGGPSCSLIGNALEKGYGITPVMDHWSGIMRLEAVLPNGELYRNTFQEFGAGAADSVYKWKVGPYLDGLFAQGNFGIVTQATIALSPRPDVVGQFIAFVDDAHLGQAVEATRRVMERYGSIIGGVNLMNAHRVLSMVEKKSFWKIKGTRSEYYIHRMMRRRSVPQWSVMVGIYSPAELQHAVARGLKKEFAPISSHTVYLNRWRVNLGKTLFGFLPDWFSLKRTLMAIEHGLDALEGVPTEVALPLAYLKNPHHTPERHLHPDHDGAGLLWYVPIVPTTPELAVQFAKGVKDILVEENLEPLITLSAVSSRILATNIPIVFNRDDASEVAHAKSALKKLMKLSVDLGCFPDRLDIDTMREFYDHATGTCFDLIDTIKNAVDPNGIINPGRYSRLHN